MLVCKRTTLLQLAMPLRRYTLGLMSGTSLDGIDCALVDFATGTPILDTARLLPFAPELRDALHALQQPGEDELHHAALAGNALADAYACAVEAVLAEAGIDRSQVAAVGMHGQTVRHRPELGYTLQIGNAARLAEQVKIPVIADFRSRDVAAGGQGAPLVPAFHAQVFGRPDRHRVIVNIGGIANVTDLPPQGPVRGWDCGPGNLLLDAWMAAHQQQPYDRDGAWAASGQVDTALLARLLEEPFFDAPPPKSTGRDLFHLGWLRDRLLPHLAPVDVQATLLALTVWGIARDIERYAAAANEVFVCGGGARNGALMRALAARLSPRTVESTASIGLDPDWVEAVAFAWLAWQHERGEPGNLPDVTGALGQRILGARYPA